MAAILASTPRTGSLLRPTTPTLDEVVGSYRLRFASTPEDVEACQRVRFQVFNVELKEGLVESHLTGLDRDRYDAQCDHLLVEDAVSGEVVGTYRMQTHGQAVEALGYYSQGEFELASIPATLLDESVELGRACILAGHRNRRVLFLLWRGLAAYAMWNEKRWMLGCSSLTSTSPEEGYRAFDWLSRQGFVRKDLLVPVRAAYRCEPERYRYFAGEYRMPPLFDAYMRHGARVCSPPALDEEFRTIDFLTLIDVRDVRARFYASLTSGLVG